MVFQKYLWSSTFGDLPEFYRAKSSMKARLRVTDETNDVISRTHGNR